MAQGELEALQAQVKALREELETLRIREGPQDRVRGVSRLSVVILLGSLISIYSLLNLTYS
jgi:hypothetical protein